MKVLLIIDMLNGFCRKGFPLSIENSTEKIETYISHRIEETIEEKGKVIFVCDSHKITDPEINNPYPPHCMEGTGEAEIVDSLIKNTLYNFMIILVISVFHVFLHHLTIKMLIL